MFGFTEEQIQRYSRQIILPDVGGKGQKKLLPTPPPPGVVPSCQEAGVFGAVPGVIGTIQAVETIKLLLGVGHLVAGAILGL